MRKTLINGPILAAAAVFSLAACGERVEEDAVVVDAGAPAASTVTAPAATTAPTGGAMVPEMQPTGDLAPAFGTAPAGGAPAQPTGAVVPEMSPTGAMKPAVNPNQPSQPAPAPAK